MTPPPKHRFYISEGPGEARGLCVNDNRPSDFLIRRAGRGPYYGETYLARIEQWSPGMNGVFVSLGEGGNAFMPVTPAQGATLKPGDLQAVTVTRSPSGDKPARVSSDIVFPGPRLAFIPAKKGVHLSHKAKNRAGQAAQLILHRFNQEGLNHLLIRESAFAAHADALLHEARYLTEHWRALKEEIRVKKQPGILKFGNDVFDWSVADAMAKGAVYVGSEKRFHTLRAKWRQICPDLSDRIELCDASRADAIVDEALEGALSPVIPFAGGGKLYFDETHALTAIDVNGFPGNKRGGRHQLNLNLQAAPEIVRQIRLRGIGGAIVIDFVTMPDETSNSAVESEMRKLFVEDIAETDILPVSRLGLLQMTREKNGPSVTELYCENRDKLPLSHESVTINLLRKLERTTPEYSERKLTVCAHPDFLEWLNNNGARLGNAASELNRVSEWKADPKLNERELKLTVAGVQAPIYV